MSPGVGAVVRSENRNVAYDLHAPLVRVGAQRAPLAVKKKLGEFVPFYPVGVCSPEIGQSVFVSCPQGSRPSVPRREVARFLYGREQGEIVEPVGFLKRKGREFRRQVEASGADFPAGLGAAAKAVAKAAANPSASRRRASSPSACFEILPRPVDKPVLLQKKPAEINSSRIQRPAGFHLFGAQQRHSR